MLFIKRPPPRNVAEPNAKPLTIGFLFRNRRYLRSVSLGIGGFTSISGLLALIGVASSSAIRFNRRSRTSAKIEPGTPMKGLHWPTTPRGTIEPQRLFRALANPNSSDIGAGRPYLFGHVASRVSLPKTRPPPPDLGRRHAAHRLRRAHLHAGTIERPRTQRSMATGGWQRPMLARCQA